MAITVSGSNVRVTGSLFSGTATSGSTTTLNDSGASFSGIEKHLVEITGGTGGPEAGSVDAIDGVALTDSSLFVAAHVDRLIRFDDGAAEGSIRHIKSVAGGVATLDRGFDVPPQAGDNFTIIGMQNVAQGGTSTQLTFIYQWPVAIDNTSVYRVYHGFKDLIDAGLSEINNTSEVSLSDKTWDGIVCDIGLEIGNDSGSVDSYLALLHGSIAIDNGGWKVRSDGHFQCGIIAYDEENSIYAPTAGVNIANHAGASDDVSHREDSGIEILIDTTVSFYSDNETAGGANNMLWDVDSGTNGYSYYRECQFRGWNPGSAQGGANNPEGGSTFLARFFGKYFFEGVVFKNLHNLGLFSTTTVFERVRSEHNYDNLHGRNSTSFLFNGVSVNAAGSAVSFFSNSGERTDVHHYNIDADLDLIGVTHNSTGSGRLYFHKEIIITVVDVNNNPIQDVVCSLITEELTERLSSLETTFNEAVNASETAIDVVSAANIEANDAIYSRNEIMSVSSKSVNTLTVVRGAQNSNAQAENNGDDVYVYKPQTTPASGILNMIGRLGILWADTNDEDGPGSFVQEILTFPDDLNIWDTFRLRSRKYGFAFSSVGVSLGVGPGQLALNVRLVNEVGQTQSQAAADAHTGITITEESSPVSWQGEDFSITIEGDLTTNPSLTIDDIWHYLHSQLSKEDVIGNYRGIHWHNMLIKQGTNYFTEFGEYSDGTLFGSEFHGVRVVDENGNPFPGVSEHTADNGNVVGTFVSVKVTALTALGVAINGARVYLEADSGGALPAGDSVTITRSGGTATVTHTAHGMVTGQKVKIRGANQNEYNIKVTITVTGVNTYTFPVSGSPTTPATGTITCHAVILDDSTDSNGEIEDQAFLYSSNQPVSGRVRRGTNPIRYKSSPISGAIGNNGFLANITMVEDE